ncbi:MAG: LysR family hydrogen peroxide-inducible transcriptional activator [Halioglobus sp.]|jgi:LysR family hydrogen peroxide-inducible transcriptional activator
MISLKQVNYALAVEKTLHFKKAAEACNVSQSALSTALMEMEKQLGFQVFERNNKKVMVTPLGQQVLEKAKVIKLQMDDLSKLSRTQNEPLSYPISIGMIPTIGPYILPMVLPTLNELYPDLKLGVVEEQSHVLVDMVRSGDIDTAILALPYDCSGLLTFEFWGEDFYWATHCDDIKGKQTEIGSDELDRAKLMLLKDGHCLKDHALAACKLPKENSAHSLGATSLATLIQLVAGKVGTTLVPQMALDQLININPSLTAVHLNEPSPHRKIAFVVRPNYARLNDIEHLMALFKEQLQKSVSTLE